MRVLISKYKLFRSSSGVCHPGTFGSYVISACRETKRQLPKPQLTDSSLLFWGGSAAFLVLLCETRLGSSSSWESSPGISLTSLIF